MTSGSSTSSSPLSSLSDYPEDNGEVEIEDETAMIEDIKKAYAEGVPLFSRKELLKLSKALDNNDESVELNDWVRKNKVHDIKAPRFLGESNIPVIAYRCYQGVINPCPDEHMYENTATLEITWREAAPSPQCSLQDLRTIFQSYRDTWLQSSTCSNLSRILESAKSIMTVDKVGGLSIRLNFEKRPERGYRNAESCTNTQHAAALTIADILNKSPSTFPILAQDPEYCDLDEELVYKLGITIVEDPKGFLAVDDKTSVISVACNVPQNQIIADLARPAGILWNTIEEEESEAWTKNEDRVWQA